MLRRILKFLLFLLVLAVLAFIGFAYLGDLTPERTRTSEPITIDLN